MTDIRETISAEQYVEFAKRDDCLDTMVPSDLRLIVGRLARAEARIAKVVDHILSYPVDTSIRASGYDVRHDPESVLYAVAVLKGEDQ